MSQMCRAPSPRPPPKNLKWNPGQRWTDAKHNTRIILANLLKPDMERELEMRRLEWLAVYDQYLAEFCDGKWTQGENLTDLADSLSWVRRSTWRHVEKDEKVGKEFLMKNQKRLNGHMSMIFKMLERLGTTRQEIQPLNLPTVYQFIKIKKDGQWKLVELYQHLRRQHLVEDRMTIFLKGSAKSLNQ